MNTNVSFPPTTTHHLPPALRCLSIRTGWKSRRGRRLANYTSPRISRLLNELFFYYFHRLLTHNCFLMLYNHLNRSCSRQHGRERSCVGRRSRMGDTTSICGWWDDNGFIWHKLGFNMNLGYGTCCSFNLCKYDGRDFLTREQTCVSEGNSRTNEWGM